MALYNTTFNVYWDCIAISVVVADIDTLVELIEMA